MLPRRITPLGLILVPCLLLLFADAGPFGVMPNAEAEVDGDGDGDGDKRDQPPTDLGDEDLLSVMEEFALMSDEEMEEAFAEVVAILGDGDPDAMEALRRIKEEVKSMSDDRSIPPSTGASYVSEGVSGAAGLALEMMSEYEDWEEVYRKRHEILDSLIAGGKLSAEDEALYRSNDGAWEEELRSIAIGLQTLARREGSNVDAEHLLYVEDEL